MGQGAEAYDPPEGVVFLPACEAAQAGAPGNQKVTAPFLGVQAVPALSMHSTCNSGAWSLVLLCQKAPRPPKDPESCRDTKVAGGPEDAQRHTGSQAATGAPSVY